MKGHARIEIPPHVADVIRDLPPDIKRGVREALRRLAVEPEAGTPLVRDLEGLWRYRVRRFRIVYQPARRTVRVVAVGHRRSIYERLAESIRGRAR